MCVVLVVLGGDVSGESLFTCTVFAKGNILHNDCNMLLQMEGEGKRMKGERRGERREEGTQRE